MKHFLYIHQDYQIINPQYFLYLHWMKYTYIYIYIYIYIYKDPFTTSFISKVVLLGHVE